MRGILTGALVLVVLQTVVTRSPAGRIRGLGDAMAGGIRRLLDPTIPAIAERK